MAQTVKASAYNVGNLGSIPGLGRSTEEENGNPLQHSCLENPIDGRAWQATVHGVTKSQTQLSDFTFTFSQEELYLKLIKQRPAIEVREELARRLSGKESTCQTGEVK